MIQVQVDRFNEPVFIEKVTVAMSGERLEGGYELIVDGKGHNVTRKRYRQAACGYKYGGLVIL
ncbi:hypothetical protein, partial [Pseudoalteromonas sp. S1649]|uniref:hypothetical protein n=1 Tax=Pseudoalteromonas sp. S1649 TaxID=579508 RepID=UPI001486522B